jgi:hypothetical protein
MAQLTYYVAPWDQKPELPAEPVRREVLHGYTLDDLEKMTRAAVIADRSMAMDYATRHDVAWSAIAEHLVICEDPPIRQELIRIGWQAIYREARTAYRERGRPDTAWQTDDYESRPRFALYWRDHLVTPSHEGRIVESIAVHQVLARLTPTYADAIVALAAHNDYAVAAAALRISYKALVARIGTARARVLALWHQGETPHRPRRTDRRVGSYSTELATHCSNGHEWTPENTRIRTRTLRGKRHTSRACKACEHERSIQRTAKRQAASAA